MSLFRIDTFEVPETLLDAFRDAAAPTLAVIRTQEGFIQDQWFEKHSGDGRVNVVTMAEWRDAGSIARALEAVTAFNQRHNANPAGFLSEHGIIANKAVFESVPGPQVRP